RSNVSLATQFFQQPARRTVLARSRLQGNSTTQAVNRSLASFYACDALGTHDATGTTVTVFQRVLQCAAATLCQSGNLSFETFQFRRSRPSPTGFDRTVCAFAWGVERPGTRTVNTEPLPGSLVTVTSPPIMRASLREMARPSPVPP